MNPEPIIEVKNLPEFIKVLMEGIAKAMLLGVTISEGTKTLSIQPKNTNRLKK